MSDAARTVQVQPHSHCEICQKAIRQGDRFCGPECEAEHDKRQAEKKKFIWKQVALIAAVMLVLTAFNQGWI